MFGSNALETLIGVIFVFLCVSLVCTASNELLASLLRSRARDLERGIRNILDGTTKFPIGPLQKLGYKLTLRSVPKVKDDTWGSKFLRHQLINAMSKDGQQPSYIPSATFAAVVMHLIAAQSEAGRTIGSSTPTPPPLSGTATFDQIGGALKAMPANPANDRVREALVPLVEDARSDRTADVSDTSKFHSRVEAWYEHAMDRVGGWYKRRTQIVLFLIALGIVCVANVDTIAILRSFSRDATLRASVVAAADSYTRAAAAGSGTATPATQSAAAPRPSDLSQSIQQLDQGVARISRLGVPIGWVSRGDARGDPATTQLRAAAEAARKVVVGLEQDLKDTSDEQRKKDLTLTYNSYLAEANRAEQQLLAHGQPDSDNLHDLLFVILTESPEVFWTKVLGLLLTAFAASLGAPFWFDVLSKFMAVRGAGKPPEEKSKDSK